MDSTEKRPDGANEDRDRGIGKKYAEVATPEDAAIILGVADLVAKTAARESLCQWQGYFDVGGEY